MINKMEYSYDSDDNIVRWKKADMDAFDFFTKEYLATNVLNEDTENRYKIILDSLLRSDGDEIMFICALMNAYVTVLEDQSSLKKLQLDIAKIQKKWKMRYQQGCKQISQKLVPALGQKNKKQFKTKGIAGRQLSSIKPASGFINMAKGYFLPSVQTPPLLNGQGKLTLENGSVLQGIFDNGILNGMGKSTEPDGTVYIGNFQNNAPKGEGMILTNGSVVTGIFDGFDCNRIKDVIIKFSDGSLYSGETKDCKITGRGELKLSSGKIIIGNFINGVASGQGEILENGYKYFGEIANNNANGIGILHGPDGSELEGFFKDNLIQGIGQCKTNDLLYYGEFKDNHIQGRGLSIFNSGSAILGTVMNDSFMGDCIGITENFIYDGEMKGSTINGCGTKYYNDGRIISGNFVNGELVAQQQQKKQQKSQIPTCNSQAIRDLLKFFSDIMENTPNLYAIEYLTRTMNWLNEQLSTGIYKHCFEFQQVFASLKEQFDEWNSDPDL